MKCKLFAALAAASLAFALPAQAQDFPTRTITMVIPFAAGGPTDVLGRLVAARMSEVLGQTVIVENITGAGGQTGSLRVANAAPDGYQFRRRHRRQRQPRARRSISTRSTTR